MPSKGTKRCEPQGRVGFNTLNTASGVPLRRKTPLRSAYSFGNHHVWLVFLRHHHRASSIAGSQIHRSSLCKWRLCGVKKAREGDWGNTNGCPRQEIAGWLSNGEEECAPARRRHCIKQAVTGCRQKQIANRRIAPDHERSAQSRAR